MYRRIEAAGVSHIGKARSNNEDNLLFAGEYLQSDHAGTCGVMTYKQSIFSADEDLFFSVFDGMGGGDYGEIASYTAARQTADFIKKGRMHPFDVTRSLTNMCEYINAFVYNEGVKLGAYQMGSTLTSVFFHEGYAWICNLGDSRCFLLSAEDKALHVMSRDHVEKVQGERKPILTQYLGINPEAIRIEPAVRYYDPHKGDKILLCSDGLTDMVPCEDIREVLLRGELKSNVNELLRKSLDAGGKDNITIILCECL